MAKALHVKLIYNHTAGNQSESPQQLVDILLAMQANDIHPEVFVIDPNMDVANVVRRAQADGTRLVVVAGGDGTVDSVAHNMVNSPLRLGIIPVGTRNNLALNLNIPSDILSAVKLLRRGHALRIDVGRARSGGVVRHFLELATIGLLSDLYEITDELQHGDITRVGEWLSTFMAAEPSQAQLILDRARKVGASGHMVLVANMPYIGPNIQIDPKVSYRDGKLDVFVFSDMSKFHFISFALRSLAGTVEKESIKHFQVKQLKLDSKPAMNIMTDGLELGSGPVKIEVLPKALTVMAGRRPHKKKKK
ncbi:MAG: hypothetical protein KIT08_03070 [Anaerolineales bacterium]|nr:MAG: hypothetical protein KIT08_03070 [Anaerolineales bacterium]